MVTPSLPFAGRQSWRSRGSIARLWSGLSRNSRRLLAAGFGLAVLMVMLVALAVLQQRRVDLDDARRNLGKLGIAIAEQTSRSVQAVDLVLQALEKEIREDGISRAATSSATLQSSALQRLLHRYADTLPQSDAFTIIDANGTLVNSSRQWPVQPIDMSDRDYVRHFRDVDNSAAFISEPVHNRSTGSWTAYVVRRVDGPDGQLLCLVLGALDFPYFRDFYQALTAGTPTAVSLRRRDGTLLTSVPQAVEVGAGPPVDAAWQAVVAQNKPDTFVGAGPAQSGTAIVSVHPLADYPLVVDVSVSEWDALANWRQTALLAAIACASAALCVILLLRALTLQLRRLERSEASLAERNKRIEGTNQRIERQAEELQASRERLAQQTTALNTTLHHMNQGIMMVDANRVVVVCNARAMAMLDLPPELMDAHPTFDAVADYQRRSGEFPSGLAPPGVGSGDWASNPMLYERKRPNGRIIEINSVPLPTGGMVRTYTDVTERRLSEEQVRYFAHHDDLTKLVNRVVFQDRLRDAIELADRTGRAIAVLYLDLDRFKLVNDTRGHGAGDKLLVQLAARLRGAVRDSDTVARMGGDEFAIIQPLVEELEASTGLADRILQLVKQPFDIDGVQCRIGVSIGIAHYPGLARDASDLLRKADTALYRAKADGRGVYAVFQDEMDQARQQQSELEQELRDAVERQEFEVEYQPIVETASRRIVCCEALLRWRHPTRGTIAPDAFLELAESSGLIIPIGLKVINIACAEAVTWPAEVQVSVNLSPAQFHQPALVEQLSAILESTGLAHDRLVLEVTEGLLLEEAGTVLDTMSRLRALGVRFSLDDFGTAHSRLSYLRQFPFDTIKIDMSFVHGMLEQKEMHAIVAAALGIGAALNLGVIAEGVETEAQLAELLRLQCGQVQGNLLGRPREPGPIFAMLRAPP